MIPTISPLQPEGMGMLVRPDMDTRHDREPEQLIEHIRWKVKCGLFKVHGYIRCFLFPVTGQTQMVSHVETAHSIWSLHTIPPPAGAVIIPLLTVLFERYLAQSLHFNWQLFRCVNFRSLYLRLQISFNTFSTILVVNQNCSFTHYLNEIISRMHVKTVSYRRLF